MRLTISREGLCNHEGSMRCERCFSRIVSLEKEGPCILEQVDDGVDLLTLVIVEAGQRSVYILTQDQLAPLLGESWSVVMEGIRPYRQDQSQ